MRSIVASKVSGVVRAPSSKSMMQRAVAAACLSRGQSRIFAPSFSDDGRAALRVAAALGATVEVAEDHVGIMGGGAPTGEVLDCGEAGFSLRMFSAIAGVFERELTLTGHGTLTTRPMDLVEAPLRALGVAVRTDAGRLPVVVRGPLRGGEVEVDGSLSSQFISGLLMALPLASRESCVRVKELKSKPYVAMTLEVLRDFGVTVRADADLSCFEIAGGQEYSARDYTVEGDWSGASCLLAAGAIAGNVVVTNLRKESLQADRAMLAALERSGAWLEIRDTEVRVRAASLRAFSFDATECPDLFPALVALASAAEGVSSVRGAARLRHKESDRAGVLSAEYGKLGIEVVVDGDEMRIRGGVPKGADVDSHEDHRIAMSLATAALRAEEAVRIRGPECVAKSFPEFFEVLDEMRSKV